MVERKIVLLNNIDVIYKNSGVEFAYKNKNVKIPYSNPSEYPYFSLILLSAQEDTLDRALNILNQYKSIPVIREIIIVGNKFQDTSNIAKYPEIKFITNKKYKTPIITSVKYALFCTSKFSDFAIISPVSKKQIDEKQLESFMKIVWKNQIDFSVPVINNERMHPIIVKHTEFEKIKKIRKEQGIKYFSKKMFKEISL
jgi:CTP:molybdopterin cytidylyltransferase MocA